MLGYVNGGKCLDSLGDMHDDLKSSQPETNADTEEVEFWCTGMIIYLFY